MVTVARYPSGPFKTNAYLLICDQTRQGVIIDPAPGSCARLTEQDPPVAVQAILLTHSHWDHIGDLAKVKKVCPTSVFVHPSDRGNVVAPGSDGLPLPFPIEGVQPEEELTGGRSIEVGPFQLEVIATPGHTPGSVCLYLRAENILFSGDTLFKGSIGNLSFPTGEPEKMWPSLKKLELLPPQTVVYPGHGPQTTIGEEEWLPRAEELFR